MNTSYFVCFSVNFCLTTSLKMNILSENLAVSARSVAFNNLNKLKNIILRLVDERDVVTQNFQFWVLLMDNKNIEIDI